MKTYKRLWIRAKRKALGLKPGAMFATFGKGRFVDVTRTIDGRVVIHSHTKYPFAPKGTILLIPYKDNHGVMVEFINESGTSEWRNHMSYQDFYTRYSREAEPATSNHNRKA